MFCAKEVTLGYLRYLIVMSSFIKISARSFFLRFAKEVTPGDLKIFDSDVVVYKNK